MEIPVIPLLLPCGVVFESLTSSSVWVEGVKSALRHDWQQLLCKHTQ